MRVKLNRGFYLSLPKMDLIKTWSKYKPIFPYILPEDYEVFKKLRDDKKSVSNWDKQIHDPNFLNPKINKFHLGILPQPFIGNLKNASIFILLLNPGFGPGDYYAECKVPGFKKALKDNLKQNNKEGFLFLNPKYSWHGGFIYWHKKLEKVIQKLSNKMKISFSEARQLLAANLACIELFPYHSRSSLKLPNNLPSSILARGFVSDLIRNRVERKKAIVIATRHVKEWELPSRKIDGVIKYKKGQTRGAHLTPGTPGGDAIFEFLSNRKSK